LRLAVAVLLVAVASPAARGDEADSRVQFEAGLAHYRLGEYDQAIDLFKQAYRSSPRPLLLYNIAQAYRLEGSCAEAARFYRSYLRAEPSAADRASIEARLPDLDACARRAALAAVAPRPPPPPPRHETHARRSRVPLYLAGAGAALALGGGALLWRAEVRHDQLADECGHSCPRSSWERWQTLTHVSHGLLVAGGLAAAAGLAWWALAPVRSGGIEVAAAPLAGGAAVLISGELPP
jgi:tetratricopeptide (TPR) repeat protein